MFCSKCGQSMSDETVFCPNCGTAQTKLDTITNSTAVTPAQNQPSAEDYALASSALKFGILSLVFSWMPVLSILGIIFGVIGKKKANQARSSFGGYFAKCRTAYILSCVGLGISIAMIIFWPVYILAIVGIVSSAGNVRYTYRYYY